MAEVFTISGADPYGTEFGASDVECAQEVKVPAVVGIVSRLGALPVGAYGVYRTIKPSASGTRASGVVGLVAAAALWYFGGRLFNSAARRFAGCTGRPLTPPSPLGP